MSGTNSKKVVVALGGNAFQNSKEDNYFVQLRKAEETGKIIAQLSKEADVIVTHGNGPQVGEALLRVAAAEKDGIDPIPLHACVANTQARIGFSLERGIRLALKKEGIEKEVACVITQVIVDENDPAFSNPSKPIGPFMTKEEAEKKAAEEGWSVVEDAGRGWRRVVPSPKPLKVVELPVIKKLLEEKTVVIAAGGGGIPVRESDLSGLEAVIDKDLASSLLARNIGADMLIIATAVEKVCLNFGKPNEKKLDRVSVKELKKYAEEGHFKPGSMLPKVQACIEFVEATGNIAVITHLNKLAGAVGNPEIGTVIVP